MDALWFVVAALGVWRVARMIAREDGPFDLFAEVRGRIGQATWVGRGLHCVLCVSWWLAWPAALLLPWADWREYVLLAMGLSGAVVVLHTWEVRSG